ISALRLIAPPVTSAGLPGRGGGAFRSLRRNRHGVRAKRGPMTGGVSMAGSHADRRILATLVARVVASRRDERTIRLTLEKQRYFRVRVGANSRPLSAGKSVQEMSLSHALIPEAAPARGSVLICERPRRTVLSLSKT